MEHPAVGGHAPEQVALRRAVSLAYPVDDEIRLVRKGQSVPSESPVAPLTRGFDPEFRSEMSEYNPSRARALLDAYSFIDRDGDGWRERPDGSPLVLEMATQPDQLSRQLDELWGKAMAAIGIQIRFKSAKWPENLKNARVGKLMMWRVGWSATTPDGERSWRSAMARTRDRPTTRASIWNRSTGCTRCSGNCRTDLNARQRSANRSGCSSPTRPYKFVGHRIDTAVSHRWVIGYRRHPFMRDFWKYVDVDAAQPARRPRDGRRSAIARPPDCAAGRGPCLTGTAAGQRRAVGAGQDAALRLRGAETGFDPAQVNDIYSRIVISHIFDGLYDYDHLARPYRIVPVRRMACPRCPTISASGPCASSPASSSGRPGLPGQAARVGRRGLRLFA